MMMMIQNDANIVKQQHRVLLESAEVYTTQEKKRITERKELHIQIRENQQFPYLLIVAILQPTKIPINRPERETDNVVVTFSLELCPKQWRSLHRQCS